MARWPIIAVAGWWWMTLTPKSSDVTMFHTQRPYCWYHGSFKPNSCRMRSNVSRLTVGSCPKPVSASPGML
jgi:hypothetical protein